MGTTFIWSVGTLWGALVLVELRNLQIEGLIKAILQTDSNSKGTSGIRGCGCCWPPLVDHFGHLCRYKSLVHALLPAFLRLSCVISLDERRCLVWFIHSIRLLSTHMFCLMGAEEQNKHLAGTKVKHNVATTEIRRHRHNYTLLQCLGGRFNFHTAALVCFKLQQKKWQSPQASKEARTPAASHPLSRALPGSQLGSAACPAQRCWDTERVPSCEGRRPFRSQIGWRSHIIFSGDLYCSWDIA